MVRGLWGEEMEMEMKINRELEGGARGRRRGNKGMREVKMKMKRTTELIERKKTMC